VFAGVTSSIKCAAFLGMLFVVLYELDILINNLQKKIKRPGVPGKASLSNTGGPCHKKGMEGWKGREEKEGRREGGKEGGREKGGKGRERRMNAWKCGWGSGGVKTWRGEGH
jgi:hypothetical protein